MGESGSVRYCGSCGGELPGDALFCAHCGATQDDDQAVVGRVPDSAGQGALDEAPPSSEPQKRTGLKVLLGLMVVAVLFGGVAAVVALASGGGSSSAVLVFEPGRDGFGDAYVANSLGDPYDRDDRVLDDIRFDGYYTEAISETTWAPRNQADFKIDGQRIVSYVEEDGGEVTLAVLDLGGRESTPLGDGRDRVTVLKTLNGDVFAQFSSADRCEVNRVNNADGLERIGRGDLCEVSSTGHVLIVNTRSTRTDVNVFAPDGTTTEFDTRGVSNRATLSPNGQLVGLAIVEGDDQKRSAIRVFDNTIGGELVDEMSVPGEQSLYLNTMLDTGALVVEYDDDGSANLYSMTANGSDRLADGDRVGTRVDPSGTLALVHASHWEDEISEYAIWDSATGELSDFVELDYNADNAYGWADTTTAVFVDPDGNVIGLDVEGNEFDLGDVGVDSGWGWTSLREGGLLTIVTSDADTAEQTLSVLPSGSDTVLVAVDAASDWSTTNSSSDGRLLGVAVLEDSDDDDRVLYVFDASNDELVDVDEANGISGFVFVDNTIIYMASESADLDDVETRRFDLDTRERPEIIYEGARTYVPRSD